MKIISATYHMTINWDLDELEINSNDIEEYYIRYATLYVKLKGQNEWLEFEQDYDPSEFQFKYPHEVDEDLWETKTDK